MSDTAKGEEITIPCPRCDQKHTYPLKVERSIMLYELIADQIPPDEKRSFRRVFICPKTGETFQARVVITESFFEKITGVSVEPAEKG